MDHRIEDDRVRTECPKHAGAESGHCEQCDEATIEAAAVEAVFHDGFEAPWPDGEQRAFLSEWLDREATDTDWRKFKVERGKAAIAARNKWLDEGGEEAA